MGRERDGKEEGEGDFKELADMVMEADKSKICSVGQQAGELGKGQCCSSSPKAIFW